MGRYKNYGYKKMYYLFIFIVKFKKQPKYATHDNILKKKTCSIPAKTTSDDEDVHLDKCHLVVLF